MPFPIRCKALPCWPARRRAAKTDAARQPPLLQQPPRDQIPELTSTYLSTRLIAAAAPPRLPPPQAYMNDFSICYTAANVVSLALMIKYGAFIPRKLKIVGSFLL